MRITVRVRPRSPAPGVGGSYGGALVVRVSAAPVDGKANDAVLRSVATAFDIPVRLVSLASGHRSPTKLVDVEGDESALQLRLEELLGQP
jgi:uncharacterized protein YggU (UPF0235/DUF167 family)